MRRSVVLPQPDGPTMANSRSAIVKLMSLSAVKFPPRRGKVLLTWSKTMWLISYPNEGWMVQDERVAVHLLSSD